MKRLAATVVNAAAVCAVKLRVLGQNCVVSTTVICDSMPAVSGNKTVTRWVTKVVPYQKQVVFHRPDGVSYRVCKTLYMRVQLPVTQEVQYTSDEESPASDRL